MIRFVQTAIRKTDNAFARLYLGLRGERDALVPFLFHSLFRGEDEIASNLVDPLQKTTVAQFRQFVEYYVGHGYTFVSPADMLGGLAPGRKYAAITFDDGYYNNALALPVLEAFDVPATFFISANHVRDGKCYWWDALHRELSARGATAEEIYDDAIAMKSLTTEAMEAALVKRFGHDVLRPRGDIDRPFTPAELRTFAAHRLVHIGNHTANHAILTNYAADDVRKQVADAQAMLIEMTGRTPISIAYPNGDYSDDVIRACEEVGLKVGFTVRPEKMSLDEGSADLMRVGRFCPHGEERMLTQCRTYRSDVQLYGLLRNGYVRLRNRGEAVAR